jgi:hypothetical protein
MPNRFQTGDVVLLRATGKKCDVWGAAEDGSRYYVVPLDGTPDDVGMWVSAAELDAYPPAARPN